MQASETAVDLRNRILQHIASQPLAELADVQIVRSREDFNRMMPPFVTAFLKYALSP